MSSDFSEKELIIFDLDGTLAPSKATLEEKTAVLLRALLLKKKVAVISGGDFHQFEKQFLGSLGASSASASVFANLLLMPTSGTGLYSWEVAHWKEEYKETIEESERKRIVAALQSVVSLLGEKLNRKGDKFYGPQIEDRGSQITFSGRGQQAPEDVKKTWDPDRSRRTQMAILLKELIPGYEIHFGGMTSLDITALGRDKKYGVEKLLKHLNLDASKALFVGDAIFPGGNDYPVRATGVECIPVSGPAETREIIAKIVA